MLRSKQFGVLSGNNCLGISSGNSNNIVWFGKDVNKTIASVTKQLPSNVKLTTIVNQPKMVDDNISHFMYEFLFAIILHRGIRDSI